MGLSSAVVSFNTGTGAAASTVTVAHGLGVTPKAVILFWGGRTETVNTATAATIQHGIGWTIGTGTNDQFAATATAQHNGAAGTANNCRHSQKKGPCIKSVTTGGAADGEADLQSWDATNLVFEILDNFAASLRISALVLGGDDITNVAVGTLAMPTDNVAGETVDYTGLGFTPTGNGRSLILMAGTGDTSTTGSVVADSTLAIGVATSTTQQGLICKGGDHLHATNTQIRSGSNNVHQFGVFFSDVGGLGLYGHFGQWITDGFQLQVDDGGTSAYAFGYLVIEGPSFAVLDGSTSATPGASVAITGAGFAPAAGLVMSVHDTNDTSPGDLGTSGHLMLGAWDGTSQVAHDSFEKNAAATSVCGSAVEYDQCYVAVDATGGAVATAMALQTRDTDGCTYQMTTADSSAMQFLSVLVGAAPVAASSALIQSVAIAVPLIQSVAVAPVAISRYG